MSHTHEPWSYPSDDGARRITNMETIVAWKRECGFTDEDARRIVACVNACVGIDIDALELIHCNGPYPESDLWMRERVVSAVRMYKETLKQRDELLASMRKIAGMPCASLQARKMSKIACDAVRSVTGGRT